MSIFELPIVTFLLNPSVKKEYLFSYVTLTVYPLKMHIWYDPYYEDEVVIAWDFIMCLSVTSQYG